MSVKWTDNQRKAITSSGCNILVSAAAGSGKTAVLVERVINLITDENNPVSADKLLIVTFTNAAASEMKTRIFKALIEKINKQPDNHFLRDQLDLLSQTQISTIHSFCQNLLKDNFYKIGISPDFKIIDNVVEKELQQKSVLEAIEKGYDEHEDTMNKLLMCYGGRFDDSKLRNMIISLYKYIQCKANPTDWLNNVADEYRNDFTNTSYAKYILMLCNDELKNIVSYYEEALNYATVGGVASYIELFEKEKEIFSIEKQLSWNEMFEFSNSVIFARLPNKTKGCDEFSAKSAKELRDKARDTVSLIKSFVPCSEDDIKNEFNSQYDIIDTIRNLVIWYGEIYAENKQAENCYDFDDLLHLTLHKLLCNEEIVEGLKNKYQEILIDEFQDTNEVNIAIFETISNGNNLFMVGDVKQSIYGFLNALPDNFVERYLHYKDDINNDGMKISLSNNFRSASNVIDFSNQLFGNIMQLKTGGVDYTSGQRLVYSNEKQSTNLPVEICVIDTETDNVLNDKLETESYFTAKKIVTMVEREKPLVVDAKTNELRPIRYSDIAILARSVKGDTATSFIRELALFGVPVICEETDSYIMAVEISTVLSFLKLIDNPYQDIPMLAVMKSPMFAFTDNELAQIKIENNNCKFYKAVFNSRNQKVLNFLETLENYIELSKTETLEFLINKIITDTGYYSFVGLLPNGAQRMANLRLLINRASNFENGERKTIFQYISYINQMANSDGQYKSARDTTNTENAVKIMTIHKSKGLEFPAVFLVRCGKEFGFKRGNTDVPTVVDGDLGIGIDLVDTERMVKYTSVPKSVIKRKQLDKDMAEEMRVLYVALTRAKNYLCIVGSIAKAEDKLSKLGVTKRTEKNIMSVNCFMDWIMMGIDTQGLFEIYSTDDANEPVNYFSSTYDENIKTTTVNTDDIGELLSYKYKYENLSQIKSKVSVTELVGNQGKPIIRKLSIDKNDGFKKSEIGTIVHFVMSNIEFNNCTYEGIKNQINNMVVNGLLTKSQAEAIDDRKIYDFYNSEVGERIRRSNKVLREYNFVVNLQAKEVLEDVPYEDNILVQGAVDCLFYEDDGVVIVDYKTGNLSEQYDKQIEIYKKCIEKLLNVTVKDTILFKI